MSRALSLPVFLLLVNGWLSAQSLDSVRLYVFLGESCVISRHYVPQLRTLHEQYADKGLQIIGLFPNGYSTREGITAFREKYDVPFILRKDSAQAITNRFEVTVTPEVVVWDEAQQAVHYQGRIDDQYARVGRRRLHPTTSELKDVLAALAGGQPVSTPSQPAIGCFITHISSCE